MPLFQTWQEAVLVSWNRVWSSFVTFIPSFIGAVVVFVIGILIAAWMKRIVESLLGSIKFDELSRQAGFEGFLKRADIRVRASELIGEVVRWLLILVFFVATVEILGLAIVSTALTAILAYVPSVLAAALVLGAGFLIANLVDGLVRGAFATISHEAARPVGRLARWVVLVVAFFAAVDQLKIAPALVDTFFQGLTWTLVLVVGLSVGLGAKDLVGKVLEDWYKKLQK